MTGAPLEILGKNQFYAEALDLLVSLLRLNNPTLAAQIETYTPEQVDSFSLWELGFDSALMIELVVWVDELGVFLPDDLPWATLTLADVYAIYTSNRVADDLRGP